jgi:hypothetical protein
MTTHKTPAMSTTRPGYVQIMDLYAYLAEQSPDGSSPFFSSIDSTCFYFDDLSMAVALHSQGVSDADLPEALEKLIESGMIKRRTVPTLTYVPGNSNQKTVYSITHKAAAIYHGMKQD